MNKKILASLAIPAAILFSQQAFANSEEVIMLDATQIVPQEVTEADLLASTEGYVFEQSVRPKSRRSALFAHILDTMAKNATLAKADIISPTKES